MKLIDAPAVTCAGRLRVVPPKYPLRLALVALLMALPLGVLGSDAGAITPWMTFGSGAAGGLGRLGGGNVDPSIVYLSSTTLGDPVRLRLVVRGPRVGKVNIQWSMICANSSSDVAQTRNFSFNAQMPRLVDLSNRLGGVKNWKVCFVEARVQYNRRGAVTLLMQARY